MLQVDPEIMVLPSLPRESLDSVWFHADDLAARATDQMEVLAVDAQELVPSQAVPRIH
jgi:hypothetical protein